MPDMNHLLEMKASEIKEMPVLPMGEWLARVGVHKLEMQKVKDGGERPVLRIPFTITSPVNVQGEVPPRIPEMSHTFWLTDENGQQDEYTLDPLKRFFDAVGVDQDRPVSEIMVDTVNQMVTLTIVHTPNPKSQTGRPYVNIRGFGKP